MILYGHPFSNHTRRVQMLCEAAGIAYEFRLVDLAKGEQYGPTFVAINPNSKVPAIDDDGFLLWDSHAIMRYLADKHGAQNWYPKELKARARVEQWLDWGHTRLGPDAGKIAFNVLFMGDKADKTAIASGRQNLEKILPVLDAQLKSQSHVCGAAPTLADLSLVTDIAMLDMSGESLTKYPNISAWYARMKALPSFAKTAPK